MTDPSLQAAVATVPAGAWAVGVSGGADSVALLSLLRERADFRLVIAHLDHETRGGASAEDACFVAELALRNGIPCVIETRSALELEMRALPSNTSARWRAIRFELFRRVVSEHALSGVILAHHADDQAETIVQRLLRGAGPGGLCGMPARGVVNGLLVVRPLLGVRRVMLRAHLADADAVWREDESNTSPKYARNRVRQLLGKNSRLIDPIIELGESCGNLRSWLRGNAPTLEEAFELAAVRALPAPLAREALRRWLVARGADAGGVDAGAVERLMQMALDAASPPRHHFSGGILVCRRGGRMCVADQGNG